MPITLIHDETSTSVPSATAGADGLWLSLADLTAATRWELKPEGVCRDTACVPLPEADIERFFQGEGADARFNLAAFATLVEQPFAHDDRGDVWYFGPPAWEWKNRLSGGLAPDFTLPDFDGKPHSLADQLGKKVFLLAWASWCSCRFNLPVWSDLREELKDQNFEVVTVACEAKGREAALPFVETAHARHPTLLDEHHLVPELYNTRNVPAAFWIDERGRFVRANDPIYAQRRKFENGAVVEVVTNERYLDAVREWVAKGPAATYAQKGAALEEGIGEESWSNAQAMTHFRLGVYLQGQGRAADAVAQFKQAHALQPDNWNYKRQAWNLGNIESDYGYKSVIEAIREPGAPTFYRGTDLTESPV